MRKRVRWLLIAGVVLGVAGASWVVVAKMNAPKKDVPAVSAATVPSGPLMVTLKLAKSKVEVGEYFPAKFRVTNVSDVKQTLRVMLCSYETHWELDNALVGIMGRNCEKNYESPKTLSPGEHYDVPMGLEINDGAPMGPLTFKAGFKPIGATEVVWSGAVTVEVTGVKATKGSAKGTNWKWLEE